ncbi:MAG TPA: hypothetical protein VHM88_07720, partial [Candidatus Acidoferrales bacterium]|nr:hypothetical protein [Candidatus Acidoferrales bacterium]
VSTREDGHGTLPLPVWNRGEHVGSFWSNSRGRSSGVCNACSVASCHSEKHTSIAEFPDAVCYLDIVW